MNTCLKGNLWSHSTNTTGSWNTWLLKQRVETIIFPLLCKLLTSAVISLFLLDELETNLKSTLIQSLIPLVDGRRNVEELGTQINIANVCAQVMLMICMHVSHYIHNAFLSKQSCKASCLQDSHEYLIQSPSKTDNDNHDLWPWLLCWGARDAEIYFGPMCLWIMMRYGLLCRIVHKSSGGPRV